MKVTQEEDGIFVAHFRDRTVPGETPEQAMFLAYREHAVYLEGKLDAITELTLKLLEVLRGSTKA